LSQAIYKGKEGVVCFFASFNNFVSSLRGVSVAWRLGVAAKLYIVLAWTRRRSHHAAQRRAAAADTRLLCWYVMTACEKEYSVLSCYYALSLSLAFVGL
jgi:hypothetical protein